MKISDWIREDWEPPFATIEAWLRDMLGIAQLEEEATYAYELRPEADKAGYAVRILIVADDAFVDVVWERPDDIETRQVTAEFYAWHEVRGVRLRGEMTLDPATLMHRAPSWGLDIEHPECRVSGQGSEAVLLAFWKAIMKRLGDERG